MDNQFFRQTMPYVVECTHDKIIVSGREGELIFEGARPKNLNAHAFLESFSNRPVSLDENKAYLYDDRENPVANIDGFNKQLFEFYAQLLSRLTKAMVDIKPCQSYI